MRKLVRFKDNEIRICALKRITTPTFWRQNIPWASKLGILLLGFSKSYGI